VQGIGTAVKARRACSARWCCAAALTRCPLSPPTQSKKRGLSLEDKRDRILEVFHESADVFVLKVRCYAWWGATRRARQPERTAPCSFHAWRVERTRTCNRHPLMYMGSWESWRSSHAQTPPPHPPPHPHQTLQDIEKLASKRGVVLQSVKEVLQTLVDDDLVHAEKIGISNYFWWVELVAGGGRTWWRVVRGWW
jgi:hypothetical protein